MMTPSERRSLVLGWAEVVGFAFNIPRLRVIYAQRLVEQGESEDAIELAYENRRQFWRLSIFSAALAFGVTGFFLKPYTSIGSVLMYIGLFLIAVQLNSKWTPRPGESASQLLNLKRGAQQND